MIFGLENLRKSIAGIVRDGFTEKARLELNHLEG